MSHADFDALRRAGPEQAPPRKLLVIELGEPSAELRRSTPVPVPIVRLREGTTYLVDGPYEVYLADGIVEEARRVVGPLRR